MDFDHLPDNLKLRSRTNIGGRSESRLSHLCEVNSMMKAFREGRI
jgi:hypothetical protein